MSCLEAYDDNGSEGYQFVFEQVIVSSSPPHASDSSRGVQGILLAYCLTHRDVSTEEKVCQG
jgi:hypothetical protein